MPNYIGYSPWMDAAQVGRGLGETLGAILFKVPEMKRQHELEQRRIDLEERRLKNDEDMSKIHGALYEAQTKNIPLMYELRKSLEQSRSDMDAAKLAIDQQEANSKKSLRDVQAQKFLQDMNLAPALNRAHMNLYEAQAHNADTRSEDYREQLINQRFQLNQNSPDGTKLPELKPRPNPRLQPKEQSLVTPQNRIVPDSLLKTATDYLNSQNQNPQETISTDSGPTIPLTHMYKVRNRYTGQLGYANENGIKDPDWEIVNQ